MFLTDWPSFPPSNLELVGISLISLEAAFTLLSWIVIVSTLVIFLNNTGVNLSRGNTMKFTNSVDTILTRCEEVNSLKVMKISNFIINKNVFLHITNWITQYLILMVTLMGIVMLILIFAMICVKRNIHVINVCRIRVPVQSILNVLILVISLTIVCLCIPLRDILNFSQGYISECLSKVDIKEIYDLEFTNKLIYGIDINWFIVPLSILACLCALTLLINFASSVSIEKYLFLKALDTSIYGMSNISEVGHKEKIAKRDNILCAIKKMVDDNKKVNISVEFLITKSCPVLNQMESFREESMIQDSEIRSVDTNKSVPNISSLPLLPLPFNDGITWNNPEPFTPPIILHQNNTAHYENFENVAPIDQSETWNFVETLKTFNELPRAYQSSVPIESEVSTLPQRIYGDDLMVDYNVVVSAEQSHSHNNAS